MSQDKKPAKGRKKTIIDVDKPGDSAPATTSRPVIVTNRPILKDPMMADEAPKATDDKTDDEKTELAHSTTPVVKPLARSTPEPDTTAEPAKPEAPEEESAPEAPKPTPEPEPKPDDKPVPAKSADSADHKSDAEKAEQAKHEADIQHLIDSKKYELPINAVEKRKSKRFIVLGIILAIFLVLAWSDIAADAGIIHINGVKPVTHFFSN